MARWDYLLFVGMFILAQVCGGAGQTRAARLLPALLGRPLGPTVPSAPPYVAYLPLTARNYLAGYEPPFGVAMYDGNTDADGRLKMQAAGSGFMTVRFSWSSIEPTAPISGVHAYQWSTFDATVTRAQTAGMSLFVMFSDNPAWAAPLRGGAVYTDHVSDLASVVSAAAERYDGDGVADLNGNPVVKYWSFYAEPDNCDEVKSQLTDKGDWGYKPSAYADMLVGVSQAIHAANPKAIVMIGGLAYDFFATTTCGQGGHYVQSFLDGVLKQLNDHWGGAANYLGALAFHYYPINTGRWPTIRDKALEIRGILAARGLGNLSFIVPEMGYWSEVVPKNPAFDSTEPKQARALVQMFVRGFSVGITKMAWFMVFDSASGTEAHGLFRGTDLTNPKPAYPAYATLTAELFGAQYAGSLPGAGIEGYVFNMPGLQQKTVVWATTPSPAGVTFHQSCVRRVDYMGNVTTPIVDGNPAWDQDSLPGQITLQVLQDQPLYVSGC